MFLGGIMQPITRTIVTLLSGGLLLDAPWKNS